MLKVGDKVKIRSKAYFNKKAKTEPYWHVECTDGNGLTCWFVKSMLEYCGKTMTISRVQNGLFRLDEDGRGWDWTEDMFVRSK